MDAVDLTTRSEQETELLGRTLAALLPAGAVLALYGDLASGKTCLTRGMTQYFTGDQVVHSPTFTLVNEYGRERPLYHIDLYRLGSEEELLTLGYEDIIESSGICVIEWADRARRFLPETRIEITLEHAGGDTRRIHIENREILPEGWREHIATEPLYMDKD